MGARLQGAVQSRVDPAEVRVFWIALVAFPILWGLLFIVALFGLKFRWLVSLLIKIKYQACYFFHVIKHLVFLILFFRFALLTKFYYFSCLCVLDCL